jgi:ABC-type multidrug transport system fused ATPase/permease subunit
VARVETGGTKPANIEWEDHSGKRVVVHAPRGSLAATAAPTALRGLDAIVGTLEDLLEIPGDKKGPPVDVYVIDPVAPIPSALTGGADVDEEPPQEMAAYETVGERGIVHQYRAEAGVTAVAKPLTGFLIARWFGPNAAAAGVFIDGIAGVAAARAGVGPSVDEADEWVRNEITSGGYVSILGGALPPGGMEGGAVQEGSAGYDDEEEDEDEDDYAEPPEGAPMGAPPVVLPAAATSFVAFVIGTFEEGSLARFLESYRPERRDEAAVAVFQKPLAALEEHWLARMFGGEAGTMSSSLKFLSPLLKPHLPKYFEAMGYMLVAVAFTISVPLVSQCVVNALARGQAPPGTPEPGGICGVVAPTLTRGRVAAIVAVLFVGYLLESLLSLRRAFVEAGIFNQVGATLRERMFAHLQRLPHRFYGEARVGDITNRLSGDLEELQASMQQIYGGGVFLVLTSSFSALTALTRDPLVGGLILLLIPVFIFANKFLGRQIAERSLEVQERSGDVAAVLQENLSAHAVVKAYGLEERSIESFRGRLVGLMRASMRLGLTGQLYEGTITFATTMAQLIVLGVGSVLVIGGTIGDPGVLVALLLLLPSIIGPIASLANIGQVAQMTSGSIKRTKEILEEPIDIDEGPDAIELPPLEKEIRFDHVTFGYEPGRPILRDMNLTIPKGTNVAIVGPSGSGKSTLVNLLLRFWDPDDGHVLVDAHDLRDVTLRSLRGQIGIVFQDTFIFNSTVRDNIGIGRPDATDDEIVAAARAAQLESFLEALPAGYDTVLGERGVRMSGGQRQRLAIARALLRDPPILILDEATSALDARTEAEILETLESVVQARTTLAITHRLAMAAGSDLIFVLDQGSLVEQGSHDELLAAGGLYRRLYDEQMSHVTPAGRPRVGLEAARLKTIPLFAGLDAETLADLAQQLMPEKYGAGEDIVRQGEPGDKLYFVTRGKMDVLVSDGKTERRVNSLREGNYFGEYALLTGEERSATVRTTESTEVYALAQQDFTALVESEPKLQEMLAAYVSERRAAFAAAAEAAGL